MNDKTLFVEVPLLDNVERVIVTEVGTVFCKTFYQNPELRKGKWLRHPAYKQKDFREWDVCSVCSIGCHRREYGKDPDGREYATIYGYKFCPNCGAKMEEQDDG